MFDDLRDDVNPPEDLLGTSLRSGPSTISGPIARRPSRFLGMSSIQRFVVAVLLLASVCVLGAVILFVSGKIGLGL